MPALFDVSNPLAIEASYNIAPTDRAAVFRLDETGQRLSVSLLRWGLIPFWAKEPSIGNKLINARAETAHEKPAFRAAYRQRRCLVPVDGFYEWCVGESGKQPYYISAANGEAFCFAGLWESWTPKGADESTETFTILTRSPNDYISKLHKRMPVIVDPANFKDWLSGACGLEHEDAALPATPNDVLVARPVSRQVNSPRNNGPELIKEVDEAV